MFCVIQFSTFSSQFSLVLIALDRLVSIFLPLRYTLIVTSRVKNSVICLAWMCAFGLVIQIFITYN
uniref:G-protein coupled receptors family 1 profile domain-containing protein n=1 Tax=Capitella teleta TaxID=283909 RepID=X2B6G5_CAPTE